MRRFRKEQIGNSRAVSSKAATSPVTNRFGWSICAVMTFAATTYAWYFSYPLAMAEVGVRAV